MAFERAAQLIYDLGFYDVILPFVFVFTIVFAVLEKSQVFGANKKNINVLVAFVVGFIFVASVHRVAAFESIAQRLALALVAMVMVALLLGAFGGHLEVGKSNLYWIMVLIITLAIFFSALGFSDYISGRTVLEVVLTPWLVMVLSFLGVIYYLVREPKAAQQKSAPKVGASKVGESEGQTKPLSGLELPELDDYDVERKRVYEK